MPTTTPSAPEAQSGPALLEASALGEPIQTSTSPNSCQRPSEDIHANGTRELELMCEDKNEANDCGSLRCGDVGDCNKVNSPSRLGQGKKDGETTFERQREWTRARHDISTSSDHDSDDGIVFNSPRLHPSSGQPVDYNKAGMIARQKIRKLEWEHSASTREWQLVGEMAREIGRLRKAEEVCKKERLIQTRPSVPKIVARRAQLGKPVQTEQSADHGSHSERSGVAQSGVLVNRVGWDVFRTRTAELEDIADLDPHEFAVIEVLTEEPLVTSEAKLKSPSQLDNTVMMWGDLVRQPSENHGGEYASSPGIRGKSRGQEPLPERIRIRSRYIIEELRTIIGGRNRFLPPDVEHYDGTTKYLIKFKDSALTMVRPFRTLFHYKDDIVERLGQLQNKLHSNTQLHSKLKDRTRTYTEHLKCLKELIDTQLQPRIDHLNSNRCQLVSFADLCYLFKPGDEIIQRNRPQAFRIYAVSSTDHGATPTWQEYKKPNVASDVNEDIKPQLAISCRYLDFDGKRVGPVTRCFKISQLSGEKPITSLDVYPLRFAETRADREQGHTPFRNRLIDRGKMFLDIAAVRHMHYSGLTIGDKDEVDSQVVVDFEEAFAQIMVHRGGWNWNPFSASNFVQRHKHAVCQPVA